MRLKFLAMITCRKDISFHFSGLSWKNVDRERIHHLGSCFILKHCLPHTTHAFGALGVTVYWLIFNKQKRRNNLLQVNPMTVQLKIYWDGYGDIMLTKLSLVKMNWCSSCKVKVKRECIRIFFRFPPSALADSWGRGPVIGRDFYTCDKSVASMPIGIIYQTFNVWIGSTVVKR